MPYIIDCPKCSHRFCGEEKTHYHKGSGEISGFSQKQTQYCRACKTNFDVYYDRETNEFNNKKEKKSKK